MCTVLYRWMINILCEHLLALQRHGDGELAPLSGLQVVL